MGLSLPKSNLIFLKKCLDKWVHFKEIAMLVALKNQIWEVISKVEKPEFRTVLQYRYIHNCTWPHIADIVKADESTVRRWHNKAIANVLLPDDAIDLKFKKN